MGTDSRHFGCSRSESLFRRACELIPGGVNSPARAFGGVGGTPIFIDRGEGSLIFDVDGNSYIDYVGSWGPLILGHAHPAVRAAIHAAVDRGTSYGAPTARESQLAEAIIAAVPSVEMVRLVNSGTEATMSALRLARGTTGRDRIVKFAGNYHGHADSLLVSTGSAGATLGVPNSPGVTRGTAADTIVLPYNDLECFQKFMGESGSTIAAVIVEPVVGNMGCVAPRIEFLRALRIETTRHGIVLIFDEVMTGFRLALGGAQERYGILPDLTTLGKIVGGGLPLAAYGGRRELMQHVLPAGKVYQAGTLSGNPIATAAGLATLELLRDDPPYEALEASSRALGDGLLSVAREARIPASLGRVGSMLTLFFTPEPPHDWDTASRCDTAMFSKFFWGMLRRGIYLPCSQFEAMFVSTAHTSEQIQATLTAASESLQYVPLPGGT